MATGFKKRAVSAERVAAVESATADVPIIGDPRLGLSEHLKTQDEPKSTDSTQPVEKELGSIQVPVAKQNPYALGLVHDIPVHLIKSNPFNPRAVYTTAAVEEMSQWLITDGQRISATGFIDELGDVVLIEGETRLRGARSGGLPTLRVEIRPRPANDRALYKEARDANVGRNDQTPLDDAIKWKEVLARKLYPTQQALALDLRVSVDHVSRVLSLASMPTRLIYTLAESPELLTLRMLNAIREFWDAQLKESDESQAEERTLELIYEAAKSGMGYRDVVSRRKSASKEPVKRTRSIRNELSFQGAKGELKSFEEEGRVELSLKGLTPGAAKELTDKLMALFPKV